MKREYFRVQVQYQGDNPDREDNETWILTNFDDDELDEEGNVLRPDVDFYGFNEADIKEAIEEKTNLFNGIFISYVKE